MPRSYGKIEDSTWDDPVFDELSTDAKLLWVYFLSSPDKCRFPGLLQVHVASFAVRLWGRCDDHIGIAKGALGELVDAGWIEYDEKFRQLLIINATKHRTPDSSKNLKGWLTRFDEMHDGPLRKKWLINLREHLAEKAGQPEHGQKFLQMVAIVDEFIQSRGLNKPHTMPHTMPHNMTKKQPSKMPHSMPHTMPHTMPHAMHSELDSELDSDLDSELDSKTKSEHRNQVKDATTLEVDIKDKGSKTSSAAPSPGNLSLGIEGKQELGLSPRAREIFSHLESSMFQLKTGEVKTGVEAIRYPHKVAERLASRFPDVPPDEVAWAADKTPTLKKPIVDVGSYLRNWFKNAMKDIERRPAPTQKRGDDVVERLKKMREEAGLPPGGGNGSK